MRYKANAGSIPPLGPKNMSENATKYMDAQHPQAHLNTAMTLCVCVWVRMYVRKRAVHECRWCNAI